MRFPEWHMSISACKQAPDFLKANVFKKADWSWQDVQGTGGTSRQEYAVCRKLLGKGATCLASPHGRASTVTDSCVHLVQTSISNNPWLDRGYKNGPRQKIPIWTKEKLYILCWTLDWNPAEQSSQKYSHGCHVVLVPDAISQPNDNILTT
jgi:hypothetical protein